MFPLPRGATGFVRPEDGPLPQIDLRAFRTALHTAARAAGGQVGTVEERTLGTPLADLDTSGFSRTEWHQIGCFGLTTLGGVLFNAWD